VAWVTPAKAGISPPESRVSLRSTRATFLASGGFRIFGFCCNLLKIAATLEKSAAAPMARARRTPTLE
jgi:hypothetical protein